jgi:hypothetical protein
MESTSDKNQVLSPRLNNLYKKIEKQIESGQKSGVAGKAPISERKGYFQRSRINIERVWPNWIFYQQRVQSFGYAALALVIFSAGALLLNSFYLKGEHGPNIIAFHAAGSLFKNKKQLSAMDLNSLPEAEKQRILTIKPMDNFISAENSIGRLYLSDKVALQIGPETSLSIGKSNAKKFVLDHGIVHFYIPKQNKKNPVIISGEDFQIKVIGTRFVLGLSENSLRLILEKGQLEFIYIIKNEKHITNLESPAMIEVLDRKTLPRIHSSQVSKDLIKDLGAFLVLNETQENFWIEAERKKSFNIEQSNLFWSSPFYGKNIPLSEIKNLYVFKRFSDDKNLPEAYILEHRHKKLPSHRIERIHARESTEKAENMDSLKTPIDKKDSSKVKKDSLKSDKFSPFHPGYTK